MKYLSLEIGGVHHVEVNHPQHSHSRSRQVEGGGRTQSSGPHQQHPGIQKLCLSLLPHLRQHGMPAVAHLLIRGEGHRLRPGAALGLPLAEPSSHGHHILITQFLQRLGRQGGPGASRAVNHHLGFGIGHLHGDGRLQEPPGYEMGAGDGPLLEFLVFPHIQPQHIAVSQPGLDLGRPHLPYLGLGPSD